MAAFRAALFCLAAATSAQAGAGNLRGSSPGEVRSADAPAAPAVPLAPTLEDILGNWSLSMDLAASGGEMLENASLLSDLASALDALPDETNSSLLDGEAVPVEPAPWSRGDSAVDSDAQENGTDSAESLEQLSSFGRPGSCARYGCVGFKRFHECQCNAECEAHGTCCPDYQSKCSPQGGGKIVVRQAWVALLDGGQDTGLPHMLCGIVKHVTKGPICHNGLIFEGSVAGRQGYFFLEYGNSGMVDLLTGKKHFGLSITPAAERFHGRQVLARRIHADFSHLSAVAEGIRDVPYRLALGAVTRLQHRTNERGFSAHPWCSDFTARVLVGIGCLRNDAAAWNAQPSDFSSHATAHQLQFTCGVEPDRLWSSR